MPPVEEIHQGRVVALEQLHFQIREKTAHCEPEIVAHQDDRLQMLAVALAQGGDQLGILIAAAGVQPLLELVDHEQQLAAGAEHAALAQVRRVNPPGLRGRAGRGRPF